MSLLEISSTAQVVEQINENKQNYGQKKVQKSPLMPDYVLRSLHNTHTIHINATITF